MTDCTSCSTWRRGSFRGPRAKAVGDTLRAHLGLTCGGEHESAPKPPAATPAARGVPRPHRLGGTARHDPAAAQGHTSHKNEVLTVEKALKAKGLIAGQYVDGSFGTKTVAAYKAWQRRCASRHGRRRHPGKDSLTRLGRARGFTVTTWQRS
ncbi:hypothetical protein J7E87_10435 [Streptomyces sp. ISL-1]|uniref:peptidoglycan-binding domain-containing protein n=1 Tax=Streptomyces sp. ISL-1 TaxID=2817657 RepID=UPI001BE8DFB0|nr:peptidoglycan-binding domain-containing protein [Streptomyces sp. ISL-1]MBT2389838.1 hypothetical protein [Streptomyces sp. ISL-1]